jgi:uncharacterized protein (TIGR02996 family)
MNEEAFLQLLAENPDDPELLLAYADWLEEEGRDDDALAARVKRLVRGDGEVFTRARASGAAGYNGRVARKWFAAFATLRVVLVGYHTVTQLGLRYMPVGTPGRRRLNTPSPDDPTSAVLYHRKSRGYSANFVAFLDLS